MFQMVQRSGKAPAVLLPVQRNYGQKRLDTGLSFTTKKKTFKKERNEDEKDKDETRRKKPKKVISTRIKSRQAPKLCPMDVYMVIAGIAKHRERSNKIVYRS
ncbi:uncharacterized protein LOC111068718 isoform X2 [Drosophila obscura]|uniref:uncharacterized protein LOC111068718 isoform X2 n=1 Tax=Drosophila obscura TaxID=7282 RepID=UPI001BB209CF|nr:uncharacterized protein LOC111068718 isoform X2 [Drosophila obscura]